MPQGSSYTAAKGDEIAEWLSQGIVMGDVAKMAGVPRRTIYDWMDQFPDFAAQIARARKDGYDRIAESCFSIADDVMPDAAEVARAKLRVWTRLELLKKWDPKRYGEAKSVAITGENGGPVRVAREMTDAELAAIATAGGG